MFLQLLNTCFALIFVFILTSYWKLIRPAKLIYNALRSQGIPGEPFVPFLGQLPRFYQCRKQNEIMKFHDELSSRHGLNYVFLLGPYPRLVTQDADLIGTVLNKANAHNYKKPEDLRLRLKPLLGLHNLLVSYGDEHDRARKLLNPYFSFENLRSMVSIMVKQTNRTIDVLLKQSEVSIHIQKEMSQLTLTVIASSAFGESYEMIANASKIVCETFIAALDAVVFRTLSLIDQIPFLSKLPFWGKNIIDRARERASIFIDEIILDRKKGVTKPKCDREDILDILLHAVDDQGEYFTDEEIKGQAMAFVLAGHQSTSELMSWIMYILMTNPSVLQACQEEVDRILPNREIPTYETLQELHICESVIYETLRLYPPIPYFVRQCTREHLLKTNDHEYRIPIDTTILVNTYLIHRHEKYWSRPSEFDYTRWLRDPVTGLKPKLSHPYCFLPFASGKHNCIGQNFALLEAKVILAMFIQQCHFELEPLDQKVIIDVRITMRAKDGIFSRIKRRQ